MEENLLLEKKIIDNKIINHGIIVLHFCYWLYLQKYTHFCIDMNFLETKDIIVWQFLTSTVTVQVIGLRHNIGESMFQNNKFDIYYYMYVCTVCKLLENDSTGLTYRFIDILLYICLCVWCLFAMLST